MNDGNLNKNSLIDYSAVRNGGAGLLDLSACGRILVSGSEAVMFLNGLITNDMKTLAAGSWMPAAFPNVQGRLLAVVRILNREDGFLIETEAATHEKVVQMLDRFTLAGDFRVTDLTGQTAMLSVQGRKAPGLLRAIFGGDVANVERNRIAGVKFDRFAVTVIRATHTGEDGLDLFVDAAGAEPLRQAITEAGGILVNEKIAEVLRIEAGIPRFGIDMDETTIVTETNLEEAVSFTKGCYLGQEIIVRIKHRGHVAKKLTGIILDQPGELEAGVKVLSADGKEIGRVTSSAFSPQMDRTIALGYVKYDYLNPGTEVSVATDNGEVGARVSELPLIHGSWHSDNAPSGA